MDACSASGLLIAVTTLPDSANHAPMISADTTQRFDCRTALPILFICAFIFSPPGRPFLQPTCRDARDARRWGNGVWPTKRRCRSAWPRCGATVPHVAPHSSHGVSFLQPGHNEGRSRGPNPDRRGVSPISGARNIRFFIGTCLPCARWFDDLRMPKPLPTELPTKMPSVRHTSRQFGRHSLRHFDFCKWLMSGGPHLAPHRLASPEKPPAAVADPSPTTTVEGSVPAVLDCLEKRRIGAGQELRESSLEGADG